MRTVNVGDVKVGGRAPLAIIAGPCVAESRELCLSIARRLKARCDKLKLGYIFKASFDKANRSSIRSARGPGMDEALRWFEDVRTKVGVPVTTDVHEPGQCAAVAQVVDLLQIPAFLCRQTDLLVAAARAGRPVNVKKGQFLSPGEMASVVQKVVESGTVAKRPSGPGMTKGRSHSATTPGLILTERGTFFGYNRLVNDFLGLGDLMELGWPVCFDVTHSTQLPGGGTSSGGATVTAGRPDRAPLLARAAVAAGVDALFIETHPQPARSLSDAATMLSLNTVTTLLGDLARLRAAL